MKKRYLKYLKNIKFSDFLYKEAFKKLLIFEEKYFKKINYYDKYFFEEIRIIQSDLNFFKNCETLFDFMEESVRLYKYLNESSKKYEIMFDNPQYFIDFIFNWDRIAEGYGKECSFEFGEIHDYLIDNFSDLQFINFVEFLKKEFEKKSKIENKNKIIFRLKNI